MKALVFWPVLLFVLLTDIISKAVAVAVLAPSNETRLLVGQTVRFSLIRNPGAAFGLSFGDYSRWIFMALTVGALIILWRLYRQTAPFDFRRALAIALVTSGALGNLIDRIQSDQGVVDFIDIGIGSHRWPVFNVADMAVSCGAFLLALVLWKEEQQQDDIAVTLKSVAADTHATERVVDLSDVQ